MDVHFNLVDSLWIPCTRRDGTLIEMSLRDALVQAHELRELYGGSPPETCALHWLLLAVLHRVFGPATPNEWGLLWRAGRWDATRLDDYLGCWRHRFDLFDQEYPFYQVAAPDMPVARVKAINKLIPHAASGINATLFSHYTEAEGIVLTAAQAARALIAHQAVALAGGNSGLPGRNYRDGPCTRGAIFLAQGDTLFETLSLNLLRYPDDDVMPHHAGDCPVWELDNDPFADLDRCRPRGYLDYLTWQSRQVHLIPQAASDRVLVREMRITQGLRLESDVLNPMKHYVVTKKKRTIFVPLRFDESRALWRNSTSLLHLRDENRRPLAIFRWFLELVEGGHLNEVYTRRYLALGMATKPGQAQIYFYGHEQVPLPLAYLEIPELAEGLEMGLEVAETVRQKLWGAMRTLAKLYAAPVSDAEGAPQPARKDLDRSMKGWAWERRYWGRLETPFWKMVEALPKDDDQALAIWRETLWRTARGVMDRVADGLGMSERSLKAATKAHGQLEAGMRKVLTVEDTIGEEEQ